MEKSNAKKTHATTTGHCKSDKMNHNTKDGKECNKK